MKTRNLQHWIQWWASRRSDLLGMVLEEVNHHLTNCLRLSICSCWEQVPKKHNPSENWEKMTHMKVCCACGFFHAFLGQVFALNSDLNPSILFGWRKGTKDLIVGFHFNVAVRSYLKAVIPPQN